MFINCTNHPYSCWSEGQLYAAHAAYGDIVDYPFPAVDPLWNEEQLAQEARRIGAELEAMQPDAVLCQGEMGMTFALVSLLGEKGIPALHACSERIAREQIAPDGRTIKVSEFVFRGFRAYVRP